VTQRSAALHVGDNSGPWTRGGEGEDDPLAWGAGMLS
jgi:hypothetical protein